MYCVNEAVTVLSESIVAVQDPVPEHPPPLQPAKIESVPAEAVRETVVPSVYVAAQPVPQLIPDGELVTVPLPVPAFATIRVYVFMNVALIV